MKCAHVDPLAGKFRKKAGDFFRHNWLFVLIVLVAIADCWFFSWYFIIPMAAGSLVCLRFFHLEWKPSIYFVPIFSYLLYICFAFCDIINEAISKYSIEFGIISYYIFNLLYVPFVTVVFLLIFFFKRISFIKICHIAITEFFLSHIYIYIYIYMLLCASDGYYFHF